MKSISVFIFSTLISISAFADFNGHWQGAGHLTGDNGSPEICAVMELDLSQTSTAFTINSGVFKCESKRIIWKPFTLNLSNNEIHDKDGNLIGSIGEQFLLAKITDSRTHWTGIYQIKITGAGMEYKQTTLDSTGKIMFVIDGLLKN